MPELFSTFQCAILEVLPMTAIMQDLYSCVLGAYDTLFDFAQIGHFVGFRVDTLASTPQDTTARDTLRECLVPWYRGRGRARLGLC